MAAKRMVLFFAGMLSIGACDRVSNNSVVGKWECATGPYGWSIQYNPDKRYAVSFNSGNVWQGTYKQEDFAINYKPDSASQSNPDFLPQEIQIIDKAKKGAIFISKPGGVALPCTLQ